MGGCCDQSVCADVIMHGKPFVPLFLSLCVCCMFTYNVMRVMRIFMHLCMCSCVCVCVCECSRFYTLIPHASGHAQPPLIDNSAAVQKKREMVEALIDIEIAASLLKEAGGGTQVCVCVCVCHT